MPIHILMEITGTLDDPDAQAPGGAGAKPAKGRNGQQFRVRHLTVRWCFRDTIGRWPHHHTLTSSVAATYA